MGAKTNVTLGHPKGKGGGEDFSGRGRGVVFHYQLFAGMIGCGLGRDANGSGGGQGEGGGREIRKLKRGGGALIILRDG